MVATIIDGVRISREVREEVTQGVRELAVRHGVTPGLAAVLVGDNPASAIYVRNKTRACAEAGIFSETFSLPQETSQAELLDLVQRLGVDARFHGVLVQLPLPPQMNERTVIAALDPDKDVDGLHPVSMGRLVEGEPTFVSATPAGIQQLLLRSGYDPAGRHLVMCGRSTIVGKPLAILMLQKRPGANATVTVCHTGTRDLGAITRQADILVVAAGRPKTITADMVSPGAVVIDVGMNRVPDEARKQGYHLEGDVDFEAVSQVAGAITPVPGGVGPMTIAMLLHNTLRAARMRVESRPQPASR
jgi:methylenetetrahydrofolate dehydrogenase (NADP+)/methenyltetrahydrofolate cyclohydrolase